MTSKPAFSSERDFVTWVQRRTAGSARGLRLGIGDDAALVEVGSKQELILTTDLSVEGIHFAPHLHSPQAVGHRGLARSLSDIAAMGGTPRYALISLAIAKNTSRAWIEGFFAGLLALAKRFDVAVIGGDTTVARDLRAIDAIVTGEVPRGQALRRSGARPGDQIFVSGCLGLAALGLQILESGRHPRGSTEMSATRAHLFPEPQCALGRFLSAKGLATAMMDLSDGLSIDLERLCAASGVGATLFQDSIPCPPLTDSTAALRLALHGGEDYQLLFTVPSAKAAKLPSRFAPLHHIGEIRRGRGVRLITPNRKAIPLKPLGYDHFTRR